MRHDRVGPAGSVRGRHPNDTTYPRQHAADHSRAFEVVGARGPSEAGEPQRPIEQLSQHTSGVGNILAEQRTPRTLLRSLARGYPPIGAAYA
jgi:hypothetical protein